MIIYYMYIYVYLQHTPFNIKNNNKYLQKYTAQYVQEQPLQNLYKYINYIIYYYMFRK